MTFVRPYPVLKDSGVTWLGNIPAHWGTRATKRMIREVSDKGYPDLPLLAATQSMGVVRKDKYGQRTVVAMTNLESLKRVQVDDFVISLRSFQGGIERGFDEGILSSAYTVLRHDRRLLDTGFLARLFKSKPFLGELELNVTGIREGQNINYGSLRETHLPLPPLDEQRAIADFLDGMDARITRFIAARRKMIALLEEKKQAVINQAVTRGLDPDMPMKDSGMDWLGDIPAHWEFRRIKHIVRSIDQGVSPQAEARLALEDSWGVLKSGCVNKGLFRQTEHKRLPDDFVVDRNLRVRVGDVIVSRASGSKKFVGSTGIVQAIDFKLILSDKTFRLNFLRNFMPEFYVRAMNSTQYRLQVEQEISGAEGLANNLPLSSLREFLLPVPPAREQQAIVRYLDLETATVDMLISRHKDELELMQEYRTRLISDVVTGKLDVRGVELPAIEEVIGEEIEAAMVDEDVEDMATAD